ncbi:unnamed protein product [Adineta steineri]|uniref:Uncharacterized protein n=1 Tax=Adineta steineri TaxID=433720 RepID=A0A813RXF7_9BILA|nr:unnamed protein product [Adineta steineri]CAF1244248.1 unnamed protein product [Adineta steineri]
MFKLLVVFALVAAIQGQLPGGLTNRPELVDQESTRAMVRLAVIDLKNKENLLVSQGKVLSVETQSVSGRIFRIVFQARSILTAAVLICRTEIHQNINGIQSVLSVECDPKI